ncbi:MAG: FRG domain-containing protein [Dorea sp.]|nr:FRG domain-containing protein [Dorea sp.]
MESRVIESLGEYMEVISQIAGKGENEYKDSPKVLWFRGLSHVNHSLLPSLYRSDIKIEGNRSIRAYSAMHYAEDIRTQHYNAKNYHFFVKEPSSRVEWLEVMQHHGVRTRAMDWSESAIHSLMFALEPFFDDRKYRDEERRNTVPCVWILEPGMLNKKIFEYLTDDKIISAIFSEVDWKTKDKMERMLKAYKSDSAYFESRGTHHIDYIVNLSSINDEILRDRIRIEKLLASGEVIHPYYYMLARIYSDGLILDELRLPPLAVVHPYHSERIKAQKGVFTIFPFYKKSEEESFKYLAINQDAMEYNEFAKKYLHKIVIRNPQKIAYELMAGGINVSWLYPEMPIVSNEIEFHRIY